MVTGATSGIGRHIAQAITEEGGSVILSGRDIVRGKALEQKLAPNACFVAGDVGDPETNELLAKRAVDQFGKIDHVVIAAGQLGLGNVLSLSIDDWDCTIRTNLSAVFYLLKYALPHIQKSERGSVVIIGSIAGQHAFPNHPAYVTSKGALPAFVRQVALDYGPEVRINLVSPAQVMTPLLEDSVRAFDNPDAILDEVAERLPMKRIGQPQDITSMVLHLLSQEASWITGSNFVVDGGFLAT